MHSSCFGHRGSAVPPSNDSAISVRIKWKLKLILRVQGDHWGLAFFPWSFIIFSRCFLFLAPRKGSRYSKSLPCPSVLVIGGETGGRTRCLRSPGSGRSSMAGKGTAGLCGGNARTEVFSSFPQFRTQPACWVSALAPAEASWELSPVPLPSLTVMLFLKPFCCITSSLPLFALC